ncbi:hypothetical protein MYOV003v1_p0048 [Vibrio phage 207E48.1]|nr:hypothetical protein MYOV003v1_p0048 [Vibrio phage 207E48.1]
MISNLTMGHNRMISGAPINVKDFGAVGDGVTDDTAAIQTAADYCRGNKSVLQFPNGAYYVSNTVYLGDVVVEGVLPLSSDPYYAKNPDGTNFITGGTGADWRYFYNISPGLEIPWRSHLTSLTGGSGIISDTASPIVGCLEGERFNITRLGVVGNHRLVGQNGIEYPNNATAYHGNAHKFYNVSVTGCGQHGIALNAGWETSYAYGIICRANNGYGIYTGVLNGGVIDSATEYLTFNNCGFTSNRLGGVFFEHVRKAIFMDDVRGNNNGQYDCASDNGRIDPLLGYDRNLPTSRGLMASLVRVNDATLDSVGGTGTCIGLNFKNIWAEQVAVLIHIRTKKNAGILNNVDIQGITAIRSSQLGGLDTNDDKNGCVLYMDCDYAANLTYKNNYSQALRDLDIEHITTFEGYADIAGVPRVTDKEKEIINTMLVGDVEVDTIRQAAPRVVEEFGSISVDTVHTSTIIQDNINFRPPQNRIGRVTVWRVLAQHQATNSEDWAVYEMTVVVNNKGQYKSVSSDIGGLGSTCFTSAPSVDGAGVLSIPLKSFKVASVERLDNYDYTKY